MNKSWQRDDVFTLSALFVLVCLWSGVGSVDFSCIHMIVFSGRWSPAVVSVVSLVSHQSAAVSHQSVIRRKQIAKDIVYTI